MGLSVVKRRHDWNDGTGGEGSLLSSNLGSLGSCFLGRTIETPLKGPLLTLLVALLKGTLLRGSISPRIPLILTPIVKEFILSFHNRDLEKLPWIFD